MKNLLSFIFLVAFFFSCGQTSNKILSDKSSIDIAFVDHIEITKRTASDTIVYKPKRLNESDTKDLVDKWNNAKRSDLIKYLPEFFIDIYFKDGTKRTFRISQSNMKERSDWCYDLGDKELIKRIWNDK